MEKTAFDARYQEYLAAIEDYLNGLFAEKPHWADLYEAIDLHTCVERRTSEGGTGKASVLSQIAYLRSLPEEK